MRAVKGTFGYLEKKKRNAILWTILCFGISLAVFLAGYLTTRNQEESVNRGCSSGMSSSMQKHCQSDYALPCEKGAAGKPMSRSGPVKDV